MRWVKLHPDGRVSGYLAEEGAQDSPHVTSIYLDPLTGDPEPARPLPTWFRALLTAPAPQFQTVYTHAWEANHWPLFAEVLRYRRCDAQLANLEADYEAIRQELEGARMERGLCEG